MRAIKFRAWNKDKNEMIYDFALMGKEWHCHQLEIPDQELNSMLQEYFKKKGFLMEGRRILLDISDWYAIENFTVMQFTGLTDKHGKEIWEGDRFNWGGFEGEVIFEDGCFVFDTHDNYSMTMRDHQSKEFEIIGNIYEQKQSL